MTIKQMIYAVETDKQGSFNKAAQTLFVSRQSLTSAINELEKELGITIFRRTNKGLITTNDGYEFLEMAKSVLFSYDILQKHYSEKDKQMHRFSIGTIPNYYVEDAFTELCSEVQENINIRSNIIATDAYQAIDDVYTSRIEIAFVAIGESHKHSWINILSQKGLEHKDILKTNLELLLCEDNPLVKQGPIKPGKLKGYSFVFWADTTMNILNLLPETSEIAKVIVENNRYIKAQYHSTLFRLLEKNKAFAINYVGMNQHFYKYPVVSVPIEEELPFDLVYIKQKACKLSPEAKRLLDLFYKRMKNDPF